MYLSALLSLYTQRIPFELDFRVTLVLTDSSGTSRYGDSGSILKNRKIGALTYKSELAVVLTRRVSRLVAFVNKYNMLNITFVIYTVTSLYSHSLSSI